MPGRGGEGQLTCISSLPRSSRTAEFIGKMSLDVAQLAKRRMPPSVQTGDG